jgi:hypothetical protein
MMNDPSKLPTSPSKWLTAAGFALTIMYLGTFAFFSYRHAGAFEALGPDQWANFLAGAFAPLAFLWLVLGFLQQGHELRQSARALWLQSEELRNSVEQQRALVGATREQIEFDRTMLAETRQEQERRSRPLLRARPSGGMTSGNDVTRSVQIENYGATCTNMVVEVVCDSSAIGTSRKSELPKGAVIEVQFHRNRDQDINGILVNCIYVDFENKEGSSSFVISNNAVDGDFFSFHLTPKLES